MESHKHPQSSGSTRWFSSTVTGLINKHEPTHLHAPKAHSNIAQASILAYGNSHAQISDLLQAAFFADLQMYSCDPGPLFSMSRH